MESGFLQTLGKIWIFELIVSILVLMESGFLPFLDLNDDSELKLVSILVLMESGFLQVTITC